MTSQAWKPWRLNRRHCNPGDASSKPSKCIFFIIIIIFIKVFCLSLFHKTYFILSKWKKKGKTSLQKHFFFSTSGDFWGPPRGYGE